MFRVSNVDADTTTQHRKLTASRRQDDMCADGVIRKTDNKDCVEAKNDSKNKQAITTAVPDLFCVPEFLSVEEEAELIAGIDAAPWKANRTGTRRIQMYGPEHDKNYRTCEDAKLTPLPQYCDWLVARVKRL